MKRLYLHIGLGKCGSSALQSWLSKNSEALEHFGYYYADLVPKAKKGKISSGNGVVLVQAIENEDVNKVISLLTSVYQGESDNYIISSESFQRLTNDQIKFFWESLNKLNIECHVISYIRSAYEHIYSAYLQRVKKHGEISLFENKKNLTTIKRLEVLKRYHSYFGERLYVVNYDVVKKDIFSSFAQFLNVNIEAENFDNTIGIVNRSLSYEESKFLGRLNRVHQGKTIARIAAYIIEKNPTKIAVTHYSDKMIEVVVAQCTGIVEEINHLFFKNRTGIEVYNKGKAENYQLEETEFDYKIVVKWCLLQHDFQGEKRHQFDLFCEDFMTFLEDEGLVGARNIANRDKRRPSKIMRMIHRFFKRVNQLQRFLGLR